VKLRLGALALCCLVVPTVQAFDLPPVCTEFAALPTPGADTQPFSALRADVEKLIETDPNAAVALMCRVIPRVARERGESSAEMAWWVGSLGTPLIAFMDRMNEALPLLAFARPIFEKQLGPNAAEVAEIHVAYAWIATRQGRNADAVAAWRDALRIREHNPGVRQIELQKVLVGLAQSLSQQRQFDEAKRLLARAEKILSQNGETASEAAAAIQNTYINIAWREEEFAAVRAHAERAIEIEDRMASPAAQRVPSYVWLGQSLERLDEFEQAEAALRKALEIAESKQGAPLQRHQATALTNLAGLLVLRGKPAEARDSARRAVELIEATRGRDAPVLVRPLQYLANAQLALGELPEALRVYERAGELIARFPNDIERPWIVAYYRGLARLQLALGESATARGSLEAALVAAGDDPKLTIERASTLLTLGVLSGSSDSAAARGSLEQALALYRARLPDTHPAILRAIAEQCAVGLAAPPLDPTSCDDAARRIERAHDADPFLRHDVFALGSEMSERRGDAENAYGLAIRALAAANTLGTPDPLWRADFAVARRLQARNESSLAIFFGKEAIVQIERLRGRFAGEERRFERSFLQDKVSVYRTVADWLMSAGRIDEGLDVLRLLKAEELYDFVLRDAQWKRESGIEFTPDESALRERYLQTVSTDSRAGSEIDRLGRLSETSPLSGEERKRLDALLAGQQQREAARAERIRSFLAGGTTKTPQPALRAVQAERLARQLAAFGPDAALAFYLLTDSRLRVSIATRRGQFEYESPVDAAALRRDIGAYLDAIARREDVSARAQALYATVARPLDQEARRAGATRLVLWLDGALRYIPFAALSDGEHYLVDRYSIETYVPRDTGDAARNTASPSALTVRGLGVTRALEGYEALPAMADELCGVVRGPIEGLERPGRTCTRQQYGNGALEGTGFADAAFTAGKLEELLAGERQFSVLHLGTHFSLRPGNARRSFLVLGDGSRLTLDAIADLDFRELRLVTLSACQSGLGGATTDDGREIEGLSAIVQRRGAENVVASLWRVEDRSTARLMREMYDSLPGQRADVAAALRRSQIKVRNWRENGRRPYQHPYYWAGFLVSVD
jgi:CHAT domain-containing protein/Flp pilus assembly protein TadD